VSDQPEKVGFEAFFETKDFKDGVKNYEDGLIRAGKQSRTFMGTIGDLNNSLGELIGRFAGMAAGASLGFPNIGASIGSALGGKTGATGLLAGLFGPIGILVNSTMKAISKVFSGIIGALKTIGNIGKTVFNVVGKAIGVAAKIAGAFALVLTGTVVGALFVVRNMARKVFSNIFDSLEQLIQGAKELQQMEVGINALVRAALVLEGEFESATDAIGAAIPISEKLNNILVEMSLNSPYALPDVYDIFRTNAAFGIALGTSVKLTEAIINLGAATGFSSSVLERIARNFAQIARNGRIFQRDIYELANAGIDLAAVLRQEMGMSIEEVNQAMARGEVAVDSLFDALISFSQTNYGQAAQDLSQTLIGLENRLKTIGILIASDFMRPILNLAVPAIETLVNALAAVTRSGVFELIGEHFAKLGVLIVGDVEWTTESVATGIMEFMIWLAETANVMLEYGFGMMEVGE